MRFLPRKENSQIVIPVATRTATPPTTPPTMAPTSTAEDLLLEESLPGCPVVTGREVVMTDCAAVGVAPLLGLWKITSGAKGHPRMAFRTSISSVYYPF